jgi:hypothetical protein
MFLFLPERLSEWQPLHCPSWRPCSQWLRSTFLALVLLAPVLAVARAAVLALVLLAPVLAVARPCRSPCTLHWLFWRPCWQ